MKLQLVLPNPVYVTLIICFGFYIQPAVARAPLVSLTASIFSNLTGSTGSQSGFQATFDRSDYAYPLPQTGMGIFGFAGELYVPESATCADEVIHSSVRLYAKPEHPNGIAFLPYRSCKTSWEWILNKESQAGRAAGALLYSLKDNAAQAAERVVVDLSYLRTPVWVVNSITGGYLARVMENVVNMTDATNLSMPIAPTGVEYQHVQDDIRLAVRAATEGSQLTTPRVFITISRSAADVATADRNFFLKAMIGVGITGIVCFFIAMIVRYFDCLGCRCHRPRRADQWTRGRGLADRGRAAGDAMWGDGGRSSRRLPPLRATNPIARNRERRVLKQDELDAMPCRVISAGDLAAENIKTKTRPAVPCKISYGRNPRASVSCPQLAPRPLSDSQISPTNRENPMQPYVETHVYGLSRAFSFNNKGAMSSAHDLGVFKEEECYINSSNPANRSGGWDDGSGLECAICLDEIHIGDVIRILPCPHIFHSACIDRWLLCQSSFCPLCKRDTVFKPGLEALQVVDQ